MAIPDYQTLFRPVLEFSAHGESDNSSLVEAMSDKFGLSEEERRARVPSGQQTYIANRATWAKTYLKKAGLVRYPKRGQFVITELGQEFLQTHPGAITIKDLRQFESFKNFQSPNSAASIDEIASEVDDDQTPDEKIMAAFETINDELAVELIDRVCNMPPSFFEHLLVGLLIAMGYGGTAEEAGRDLGGSGDGGVDGVIDQDALGVDQIYIQAKRYGDSTTVGSAAIRDFIGALDGKKVRKGIFFTTSAFTSGAYEAADRSSMNVVLIDGKQLARLMIRYEIGCRQEQILTLRKIDEDFFEQS